MGESVNWTLNDIAVHPGLYNQGDDMLADLQLAAELGKTLLERNKELEGSLRQKQNVIDDQRQEIEYLTKQTAALREVSDSRLRIYEQLEVSIQDLERQNHRLVLDNSSSKKHIKTLTATIESLELKCEELQTTIDELRLQIDLFKRRSSRISDQQQPTSTNTVILRHIDRNCSDNETETCPETEQTPQDVSHTPSPIPKKTETTPSTADDNGEDIEIIDENVEQITQLMAQLRETKTQSSRDQRRITELEEQLSTLVQQNQALENQVIQLHHSHEDEKSMYDELSTLEEVRKGQMCSRCLRNIDKSDDLLEDDDSSMMDDLLVTPQHRASFTMDIQASSSPNTSTPAKKETGHLYKDLVEKYEALLEVHRQPTRNTTQKRKDLSLHEELQMSGDFNRSVKDTDDESGHGDSLQADKQHTIKTTNNTNNNNNNNNSNKIRQAVSHTPTDFSETETSSSGFSDETSNKSTQTEDRGSFLCTIADGDDCKFSIYDDTSPVTSRFKNRPEYQQLFKEIFTVLKNTTEQKEAEAEKQPELIQHELNNQPEYDEDSQSIISSTMSELSLSQNEPTTIIENIIQSQNQPIPEPEVVATTNTNTTPPSTTTTTKDERVLRPLVRQPLEYLSVEVRKRSSSRRKQKYQQDRSDSPVTHIIGSPKISYTNRPTSGRRRGRNDPVPPPQPPPPSQQQQQQKGNIQEIESTTWNGSTLQFWSSTNRNLTASPTPSQGSGRVCFEFRPSSASQDLHKLKKLDLSYAQVLRSADTKKKHHHRQNNRK